MRPLPSLFLTLALALALLLGSGPRVGAAGPLAAPSPPDLVAASDSGASASDNVTSDTTPTFVGSAPAGSTVRLDVDDNGFDDGLVVATRGGEWSITPGPLRYGTYRVRAQATSPTGDRSPPSPALVVTIQAPTAITLATFDATPPPSLAARLWQWLMKFMIAG